MKLRSYLICMSLSVTTIGAACVVFSPSLRFIFLSNAQLNAFIIALALGGVLYAFYQVFRLRKDCEVLEDLKQGQWSFSSAPKTAFLEPISSLVSQKKSNFDPSLIQKLVDSLADRLDNERVFPRYLIGLLVFLGLLGTFWGLSQTISAIALLIQGMPSDVTNSTNFFTLLKESLQNPLSGMGRAFSSSLFGLGGSLIVGFLELQVGMAYGRFLNETDQYLTSYAYKAAHSSSISSAPLAFLQALLTRNIETVDQLTQAIEKLEKNQQQSTSFLDKLTQALALMGEQNKTHQALMVKLAEGQLHLQDTLSAHPFGPDEESRKALQNIDRLFVQFLHHQRQDREDLLKKLKEEMRLIARTIASLSDPQQLAS